MGKVIRDETGIEIVNELKNISKALGNGTGSTIYGFHINSRNSDPYGAVTYLADAVGMTPCHMDFSNDVFDWGTWGDAFFLPKPCMVKYDGTFDYYLDEDDYTKKADGTDSDIANENYNGNAMMQWGRNGRKIWLKVVPDKHDATSCEVFIADHKADENYHAWSFINSLGDMIDHFYTPIYNGSVIDNKLRSLSGKTICRGKNASLEIELARANYSESEPIWNIDTYCDVILIQYLLILIGKSLNTQSVFGVGNMSSGSEGTLLDTGTMNDKGLFWGKNSSSASDNSGVKVFGMENWWANQWRRTAGLVLVNGEWRTKLCYGTSDGTGTDDYNITGEGYISSGFAPTMNGYISQNKYNVDGSYSVAHVVGSSSTYYADYYYQNQSGTIFALRGGRCSNGAGCGAFSWALSGTASGADWHIGASPSCKPLS